MKSVWFFLIMSQAVWLSAKTFHLPASVYIWDGFEKNPAKRLSTRPYICGDTFRGFCDHIFDETKTYLNIDEIKAGDTIFLVADFFPFFFDTVYPEITCPIVLVSHNRDDSVPGRFARYLDDNKIIAWFSTNTDRDHPKLHPIPIGFANSYWPHGNMAIVDEYIHLQIDRSTLLCLTHIGSTHHSRENLHSIFSTKPYCYVAPKKSFDAYLADLKRSRFVLSPRGNGIDCHRTWEALAMGAVPIVPRTTIERVYEGLPVLIVDDWHSVTQEKLEKLWQEYENCNFDTRRIFVDYWLELIMQAQKMGDKCVAIN